MKKVDININQISTRLDDYLNIISNTSISHLKVSINNDVGINF